MQEKAATMQVQQRLIARIDHHQGARDYSAAIRTCYRLSRQDSNRRDSYARLGGLYLARAAARLGTSNDSRQLQRDLRHLRRAIGVCEAIRQRDPDIAALYEVLGRLYRLQAMRQADAGQLERARASSRAARLYFPDPWDRLALPELRNTQDSDLAAQRLRAVQRSLWHEIGLAIPERNWDSQAALLSRVVTATIAALPNGQASLTDVWNHYVQSYPTLAELDQERILRFLHETLFSNTSMQHYWIGTMARAVGE